MTLISIVIPVYNSEKIIEKLQKKIQDNLDFDYELILVNDGSVDNSWNKINKLSKAYNNISGINLNKNFGQDNAIIAGLSFAKGEYTVVMDDDLQHEPKHINKLFEKCKDGYDVVYGNFNAKQQKVWKNIGSWINGFLGNFLTDKPNNIYISPFKIFTKKITQEIIKHKSPFVYIDGILFSITNNITEIKIDHSVRNIGKSNYSFNKSLKVFFNHFIGFSILPLRIVTILGIFTSFLASLFIMLIIVNYFNNREPEGWTSLMAAILLVGGIIMFSLGVIGEYIGRLYLYTSNKPQYIIKNKIKKDN